MNKKLTIFVVIFCLAINIETTTALRTGRRADPQFIAMNPWSEEDMASDPSYDPWSDQFKFHHLSESQTVHYESMAEDLAVFLPEEDKKYFTDPVLRNQIVESLKNPQTFQSPYGYLLSKANIFKKLDLYHKLPVDTAYIYKVLTNKNYCNEADMLNFLDPSNLFEHYNTIYAIGGDMIHKMMHEVSDPFYLVENRHSLPTDVNELVIKPNASLSFLWGMHFDILRDMHVDETCLTQTYNSITGIAKFSVKDIMVENYNLYKQWNLPKTCLDYDKVFPPSYRLFDKQECTTFFDILNSQAYSQTKASEPIQYLTKSTRSHQGLGVNMVTGDYESTLRQDYDDGALCGNVTKQVIAQKYIGNPLLIYDQQKFDFRVYVLIASINPLIVYYQDGFVRASLLPYDPLSTEKKDHLTNSHLSDSIISNAATHEERQALREKQLSTFEMLADDLASKGRFAPLSEERGKKEFLRDLRAKMRSSIAHIVRMSVHLLERRSGAFRQLGFDFMLDDNLNLWFVEANHSPQVYQDEQKRNQFTALMYRDAFEIEFAYLRSRVKRLRQFVKTATEEYRQKGEDWDKDNLRHLFVKANKEKLEPEFQISSTNKWQKIVDLSLEVPEPEKYLGNIDKSCF